jgi:hypothetical protein
MGMPKASRSFFLPDVRSRRRRMRALCDMSLEM